MLENFAKLVPTVQPSISTGVRTTSTMLMLFEVLVVVVTEVATVVSSVVVVILGIVAVGYDRKYSALLYH